MTGFVNQSIPGFVLLLFVFLFSACSEDKDPTLVHESLEEFTAEDQRIIGLRMKETVLEDSHNFPVLNLEDDTAEKEIETYFNSLITTLAITSPVVNRNNYDWSITLIDNEEDLNLFSTPGGHFFIYTGLLKYLQTENELLSILAHEMMYTDRDYMVNGLKDAFPGSVLGDVLLYNTVSEIDNMALWLRDATFSDEMVLKADSFAVDIMCPFLFDAGGMVSFLHRAQRDEELICTWLQKRPSAPGRIERVSSQIQFCGTNESIYDERYLSMIKKL